MHFQLSLYLHFYLLYLLLSSCHGNDAFWHHSMLVKQSSSFSRKHRTPDFISQICICQIVRLTTEFVDWCRNVYIVQTPVRDTSRCDQRLEAAPHWHMGKHITKRHRWSSWSMEKAVTCKYEAKVHHFEHLLASNRLFSEPTHYTTGSS